MWAWACVQITSTRVVAGSASIPIRLSSRKFCEPFLLTSLVRRLRRKYLRLASRIRICRMNPGSDPGSSTVSRCSLCVLTSWDLHRGMGCAYVFPIREGGEALHVATEPVGEEK